MTTIHTSTRTTSPTTTSTATTHDLIAPYLRVSSAEQKANRTIDTQRGILERWLASQHIQPTGWYEDAAVSGTVPFGNRPDGRRLLADIQAGRVQKVIVTKLDRFGRNAREILIATHAIEQAGARLVSLKENVDPTTTAGRFFLTVLAGVAELERDMILEKTQEGMADRLTETTWMGGKPPYGYRVEGKKQSARLVVDEAEAKIVKRCWRMLVDEDMACDAIAERLTQEGIPTRGATRGGKGVWAPAVIHRMLKDSSYAGERSYRAADGTTHHSAVTPILTADQVQEAQATLAAHRRYSRQRATGAHPYLLRGLLRCGECGQPYTTSWGGDLARTGGARWRYYACSTRHFRMQYHRRMQGQGGTDRNVSVSPATCIGQSVDANDIEQQIWGDITWFLAHPDDTVAQLAAEDAAGATQRTATQAKLDEAQADLDGLQAERNTLVTSYRKGVLSESDLSYQLADIAREQRAIEARRDDYVVALRQAADLDARLDATRRLLQQYHQRLAQTPLTDALKREFIETLVREIRIDTVPDGISTRGRQKYRAVPDVTYWFSDPTTRAAAKQADTPMSQRLEDGESRKSPTFDAVDGEALPAWRWS